MLDAENATAETGIASLPVRQETTLAPDIEEEQQPIQHGSEWLQSLPWDEPIPSPVIFHSEPKRDQAELVRVIGARMQEARELCNLSQSAAARRLGYSNSSKLSKVEGATDTNSVPLWLIVRAAKVYEVSIDFLLGLTDDWEIGVPRGVQGFMFDVWEKARQRDMAALVRLHEEIAAVSMHITALAAGVHEVAQGLDIVRQRNPEFIDMPASGTLAGRLERLQEHARVAEGVLRRFHTNLRASAGNGGQA